MYRKYLQKIVIKLVCVVTYVIDFIMIYLIFFFLRKNKKLIFKLLNFKSNEIQFKCIQR